MILNTTGALDKACNKLALTYSNGKITAQLLPTSGEKIDVDDDRFTVSGIAKTAITTSEIFERAFTPENAYAKVTFADHDQTPTVDVRFRLLGGIPPVVTNCLTEAINKTVSEIHKIANKCAEKDQPNKRDMFEKIKDWLKRSYGQDATFTKERKEQFETIYQTRQLPDKVSIQDKKKQPKAHIKATLIRPEQGKPLEDVLTQVIIRKADKYLYVFTKCGNLYIHPDGNDSAGNRVTHDCLFPDQDRIGQEVLCAGHLTIVDGWITKANNSSGHYTPSSKQLNAFGDYFKKLGHTNITLKDKK